MLKNTFFKEYEVLNLVIPSKHNSGTWRNRCKLSSTGRKHISSSIKWQDWFTHYKLYEEIYEGSNWVMWKSLSRVWLSGTPRTIQYMEFSRPECWSGQPFPSPGDLSNPGIEPRSPALQADALPAEPQGR